MLGFLDLRKRKLFNDEVKKMLEKKLSREEYERLFLMINKLEVEDVLDVCQNLFIKLCVQKKL